MMGCQDRLLTSPCLCCSSLAPQSEPSDCWAASEVQLCPNHLGFGHGRHSDESPTGDGCVWIQAMAVCKAR
jgi:hypothetical protein